MTTADASVTQPAATPGAPAPVAGAPSTPAVVEYKFDAIEGIAPEFDADVSAVAKEMGWDQATAAKFRAYEAKQALAARDEHKKSSEAAEAQAKLTKEQADTQRKSEWEKANRDHKEFGGQKYDETNERVKQLVARFDVDQSFTKELDQAPELLNHPAFRGFLARIAYATADAKMIQGNTAAPEASNKSLFYGKVG